MGGLHRAKATGSYLAKHCSKQTRSARGFFHERNTKQPSALAPVDSRPSLGQASGLAPQPLGLLIYGAPPPTRLCKSPS
jgi:hypothetical protein